MCVVDLGAVARLFRDWMAAMPRVVPFYAVKANNDEGILAMLAALGAGFDCASDAEVRACGLHRIWLPAGDAHTDQAVDAFGQGLICGISPHLERMDWVVCEARDLLLRHHEQAHWSVLSAPGCYAPSGKISRTHSLCCCMQSLMPASIIRELQLLRGSS